MRTLRLRAIARKEFIQIRRDKATMYMVAIFPVMMLVLYGFGIRYDVKSVPMTVLDQDGTAGIPPIHRTVRTLAILRRAALRRQLSGSPDAISTAVIRAIGLVSLPISASGSSSRREAVVQVIVDGADNNTATIAMSYVSQITRRTPPLSWCSRWKPCCGRRT